MISSNEILVRRWKGNVKHCDVSFCFPKIKRIVVRTRVSLNSPGTVIEYVLLFEQMGDSGNWESPAMRWFHCDSWLCGH